MLKLPVSHHLSPVSAPDVAATILVLIVIVGFALLLLVVPFVVAIQ